MLTKYKIVPFCPYHFVHTILSNAILSVYHFVRTILSATILSGHQLSYSSDLFPTDLTSPAPYTSPVRNVGVIFDENLTFADHITMLSQICYMHIHDLRRLRPILDYKTACTIATSIVHSKLDYCNSLFLQHQLFSN